MFHHVAQRPGKPMWFGVSHTGPAVFALPGNPVSTLVCLARYVLPALRAAMGQAPAPPPRIALTAAVDVKAPLAFYMPVTLRSDEWGRTSAEPAPTNGSGDFTALAGTDGFVELPPGPNTYPKGFVAPFYPLVDRDDRPRENMIPLDCDRPRAPVDTLRRPIHDLRISVMDRCNFRCPYCMPRETFHEPYRFLKSSERLDFDEILRLARVFVRAGVKKLRITGGEPLLRPNLPDLIGDLTSLPGIEDIALTTNGVLLAKYATELKAAGLNRITVSLDTLDQDVFAKMSGGFGGVGEVLDGIEHARRAGLAPIKINTVIQRGVNDHTLLDCVEHFRGTGVIVRFIEYMDVGTRNDWNPTLVVPSRELAARIHARWPIAPREPQLPRRSGASATSSRMARARSGSSRRCRSRSAAIARARGFRPTARSIPACSRTQGIDLRAPLRAGADDDEMYETHPRASGPAARDRYSEQRASHARRRRPAQGRDELHRRLSIECCHAIKPHASRCRQPPHHGRRRRQGRDASRSQSPRRMVKLPAAVARELARTGHRTKKGPVFDTAIIAGVMAAKKHARDHPVLPSAAARALHRSTSRRAAAGASASSATSPCITRPASRWRR